MESLVDKESNTCLMKNYQDDEITSYRSYQDFFRICKNITKKSNKLEQIISISKDTISLLEYKNKNLVKEI